MILVDNPWANHFRDENSTAAGKRTLLLLIYRFVLKKSIVSTLRWYFCIYMYASNLGSLNLQMARIATRKSHAVGNWNWYRRLIFHIPHSFYWSSLWDVGAIKMIQYSQPYFLYDRFDLEKTIRFWLKISTKNGRLTRIVLDVVSLFLKIISAI